MKLSAILFFATQSLLAQKELTKKYWPYEIMNNRDLELVSILDQYDNLHYGAQVNECFKIPKVELNDVYVRGENRLKIFSSDNCEDGYITTVQGSHITGRDTANWTSGIVIDQ
jgi:hypothetical protein